MPCNKLQAHLNSIQRLPTNLNNSIDDPSLLKKALQKESGIILTEGQCSSQPFLDEMQRSKNLDALALP